MSNNDFPEFLDKVERDLAKHIIENMEKRRLQLKNAGTEAKEFLALLPMADKEELLNKLNELGNRYAEAKYTYADFGIPYEEQKRQERLNAMREHIIKGNIDQAIAAAKGELQHE